MKKFPTVEMMYSKKLVQSTRCNHLLLTETGNAANPTSKSFIMTLKLT